MATLRGLISADSHVYEPPHLWPKYIDPKYRHRAPRIVRQGNKELFIIDALQQGISLGVLSNAAGKQDEEMRILKDEPGEAARFRGFPCRR